MLTAEEMEPAGHVHVNAGRLWGGGVATALENRRVTDAHGVQSSRWLSLERRL